jgi:hypothetical protein
MTLHVYLKINSGINKNLNMNDIKYDSLNEIKDYIQNNIIKEEKEVDKIIDKNVNVKREEENINTRNKIQELLKKMNKK